MTTNTTLLVSVISLLFLTILIFWLYRDYRVDEFRQKLFKLRDEFFDDAIKNNIEFDSNAYEMMRNAINGFIRFAHRINLPQTVVFILIFNKEKNAFGKLFFEKLQESKRELNSEQKKIIDSYYVKMNYYMIEHIILSSPLLLLTVLVPFAFILVAKSHIYRIVSILKSPLDKLDTAALTTGQI
jgi:hypothetical protein